MNVLETAAIVIVILLVVGTVLGLIDWSDK
jgi:hypothetical protein